jgi:gluconolactonase
MGVLWILLSGLPACGAGSPEDGQAQQAPAAEPAQAQTDEPVAAVAPDIPGVVAAGTPVQRIGPEFETETIEGPIAMPDGSVIFSERDAGKTWKLDRNDSLTLFLENPNTGPLGMGFDSKGRLIVVQVLPAAQTKIAVIHPENAKTVLADKVAGRPNDLVVDKKGGVYFTAPLTSPAQVQQGYASAESKVYYLPAGGQPIAIADSIGRPNGIQLSRDEKILYVNDSQGEYMLAFDIQPDGTVRNRRNFARYEGLVRTGTDVQWPNANGLAIDSEGRLYSVTRTGVQVFSAEGEHLGTIPVQRAENLAFAGPDKKTLYIVGGGAAHKLEMLAQGFRGRAK